jgi:hypothetical protein
MGFRIGRMREASIKYQEGWVSEALPIVIMGGHRFDGLRFAPSILDAPRPRSRASIYPWRASGPGRDAPRVTCHFLEKHVVGILADILLTLHRA